MTLRILGSDDPALQTAKGDIINDNDNALLSTQATGEKAFALGPVLSDGIMLGVQNGTFRAGPNDPSAAVDDSTNNGIPYWATTTSANISMAWDETKGLKFTIPGTSTSSFTASVTRYVKVPALRSRDIAIVLAASFTCDTPVNPSGAYTGLVGGFAEFGWYDKDFAVIGTDPAVTSSNYAADNGSRLSVDGQDILAWPDATTDNIVSLNCYPPANAEYMHVRVGAWQKAPGYGISWTMYVNDIRIETGGVDVVIANSDPTISPISISNSALTGNAVFSSGIESGGIVSGTSGTFTTITATNAGKTAAQLTSAGTDTGLTIGGDTNLYRSAANTLKTDDSFVAGATSSTASQITIPDTTAGAGLTIGGDTNLYRGAANQLKTDDNLYVSDTLRVYTGSAGSYGSLVLVNNASGGFTMTYDGTKATINATTSVTGVVYGTTGIRAGTPSSYAGFSWTGTYFLISDPVQIASVPTSASAPNARISATTNGILAIGSSSSSRWKENIEDADEATLVAAKKLKAKHFNSKHEYDKGARMLGLIAEEVDAAGLNCAVSYDEDGLPFGLEWSSITAALLVRLADAERRIEELENR